MRCGLCLERVPFKFFQLRSFGCCWLVYSSYIHDADAKATTNEDDCFVSCQCDVGATGQLFSVEAEPVPKAMKHTAHELLQCRVLLQRAAHIPTAAFFGQAVPHIEAIRFVRSRTL